LEAAGRKKGLCRKRLGDTKWHALALRKFRPNRGEKRGKKKKKCANH